MTFNQGTYRFRIINNTVESNFVFFWDRPKYRNLILSNKAILWKIPYFIPSLFNYLFTSLLQTNCYFFTVFILNCTSVAFISIVITVVEITRFTMEW